MEATIIKADKFICAECEVEISSKRMEQILKFKLSNAVPCKCGSKTMKKAWNQDEIALMPPILQTFYNLKK